MIALFLATALMTFCAKISEGMGLSLSHISLTFSGGSSTSALQYFPPSNIGVRITPGHMTLTRTPKCAASARSDVERLIDSYDLGKILAEGLTLVIAGRTNVGKSTLFNALLERDRAIVTPFPGTTRDFLREKMRIKDALFTLIDMAGLGRPSHPIEKEGIQRAKRLSTEADGVLLLLDSSRKEAREDEKLIEKFRGKKTLLLFNKCDLPTKMDVTKMIRAGKNLPAFTISALRGTYLDVLKRKIYELFVPAIQKKDDIVLHLRQKLLLEEILSCIVQGQILLQYKHPEEIFAEEIRNAIPLIGRLTGEIQDEDIIQDIFSRFCVGK